MNITLYYVPGINETDTPVFDTKANQELFFAECERKVIPSGFYPPFFQNTITLSTADFNLTTTVFNYLSLEYDGKKFYYFVQSKSYVAEDLTEISIYMDVIQTYMFDITWVYSHIDRLSIKRWNSDSLPSINRDYIRENYSSGLFDSVQQRNVYNSDYSQWVLVGLVGYETLGTENSYIDCFPDIDDFDFVYKQYGCITFAPFYMGNWHWEEWTWNTLTDEWQKEDRGTHVIGPFDFYDKTLEDAKLLDAFVVPFNPFGANYYEVAPGNNYSSITRQVPSYIEDTFKDSGTIDISMTTSGQSVLSILNKCSYRINYEIVNPGFMKNTSRSSLFDWRFVPALLDTSYILLDFGNTRTRTAYPLHVSSSLVYNVVYWADITSGTIYFNEIPAETGIKYSDNKYSTIKSTDVHLGLTMRNDAWNEYIARNKATLAGAIIQSATTSLGINMNSRNDIGSRAADSVSSSWAPKRNIKGQFQKARPLTTAMHKTGSEYSSQNKGISTSTNVTANPSSLVDYGINAVNLLTTPDTIKVKGEYESDTLGGNALIYSQVVLCSNIVEVAHIYESVGYKVSINTDENLLQIQNRYYYDYVQCDEMNIHVTDIDTQEAIISRFRDGLRLWHTTDGVLNTKNVAGVTLEMGQVCIYDNVEV